MGAYTESKHMRGGDVSNTGRFSHKTTDKPELSLNGALNTEDLLHNAPERGFGTWLSEQDDQKRRAILRHLLRESIDEQRMLRMNEDEQAHALSLADDDELLDAAYGQTHGFGQDYSIEYTAYDVATRLNWEDDERFNTQNPRFGIVNRAGFFNAYNKMRDEAEAAGYQFGIHSAIKKARIWCSTEEYYAEFHVDAAGEVLTVVNARPVTELDPKLRKAAKAQQWAFDHRAQLQELTRAYQDDTIPTDF